MEERAIKSSKLRHHRHALLSVLAISLPLWSLGCMTAYKESVGGASDQVVTRVYRAPLALAWTGILDALKANPLEVANRESGVVQTRWIDNTAQRNLIDSFGPGQFYLKAQYRFRITIAEGVFKGEKAVKLGVLKEQLVKYDALEGWRPIESDLIDENTLLYRVGWLIVLKTRLANLTAQKIKASAESNPSTTPTAE